MYQHTNFKIPTSKNVGDMHWIGNRTDGLKDRQAEGGMASAITIHLSKFLRGHTNSFVKKFEHVVAANPVCIKPESPSDGRCFIVILASK